MPILISSRGLSKSFGVRPLFEGLDFVINSGERIGLIGPNGAGKSTLLRILSGEIGPDSGELSSAKGCRVAHLHQTPILPLDLTVGEAVRTGSDHEPDEATVGEVLSRLELAAIESDQVETLSGGWRKRVALARELVKRPDLLLLDEPTNHLDVESILWLESFLSSAPFSVLTVTHDRLFLQRVTNRIIELDRRNPKGLLSVDGDYATYLDRKEELLRLQEREETVLRNTLRRETEWLRRGAKARTTKQKARIQAAEALQGEVEELGFRNTTRTTKIDFGSTEKKPKRLIEGQQISKSYGDRKLFDKLDVFLGPGDRIGLLGRNGCGKSTLVRVLLGEEEPDSGRMLRSDHLKVAYYEQNREALDPNLTLRQTFSPTSDHINYRGKLVHVNSYLERFQFKKEQFESTVGKLSGGEQSRILLAKLMLREANVLVLDEPTNDLDVETLNTLQECLLDFDGAVLLVTHDRFFLDQVATQILAFGDRSGKVVSFADLSQWEQWHSEQRREAKTQQRAAETNKSAPEKAKRRKLSYNETRELEGMEKKIEGAENRLAELQAQSEAPENLSNSSKLTELFSAIAEAQLEVETLYARWAELDAVNKVQ